MLKINSNNGKVVVSLGGDLDELYSDAICLALALGECVNNDAAFEDVREKLLKILPAMILCSSEDEALKFFESLEEDE